MKPLLITFLAVLLSTVSLALESCLPSEVGMSQVKLERISEIMQESMKKGEFPGGMVMVVKDGKIVFTKTKGFHTTQNQKSYQMDDIFRIASMTKAITSVAIMQLYEKGYFNLDDPIHQYIPAFKKTRVLNTFDESTNSYTTVPALSAITIRQLLTHTSGIVYGDFEQGAIRSVYDQLGLLGVGLSHSEWNTEEFINRLAKAPLAFQPGERYNYGLNMDVLGRLIEVVSEMSLAEYFQTYIFSPLKMTDTAFYQPSSKHDRVVPIYLKNEDKWAMLSDTNDGFRGDYPFQKDNNHYAGGGGLTSTAMDYARFCQSLINNGVLDGNRILSRKSIETMTADQLIKLNREGKGFNPKPGRTYCLGFSLVTEDAKGDSMRSVGTYEWGGYFNTKFIIDPVENLVFIGMAQVTQTGLWGFWEKMITVAYSAIEE